MPDDGRVARTAGVGLVGGLVAGLLGVGGGVVFVPGLVLLCGVAQRAAHAASLAAILPVSIVGASLFASDRSVNYALFALLAVGAAVGAPLGVRALAHAPDRVLRATFAGLTLLAGLRLLVGS